MTGISIFAEDTEIFEQDSIFTNTLAQHTAENGKDTHTFLDDLFDRLDSKNEKEYPDFLAKFPYVNGGLFGQKISSPKFTSKARKTLIELGELRGRSKDFSESVKWTFDNRIKYGFRFYRESV